MANINRSLTLLRQDIEGCLGAALVDHESGMALGTVGSGINLELAAAGNMEVVRAELRVMQTLGLNEDIEDILVSLEGQYHIIRPVGSSLFLYLAFDRQRGNLALARFKLAAIAREIEI